MKAFTKTLFFAFLVMSFAFAGCNAAKEETPVATDEAAMEMEGTATDVVVEVAPETTTEEAAEATTEEVAQ